MAKIQLLKKTLMSLTLFTALATSAAEAREPVSGVWLNDTGRGAVEIYPCAASVCGRIIWLRQPISKSGKPVQDKNNPEPAARQNAVCGLEVITGAAPQEDGSWDGGRIYDPQTGKSFNVAIERLDRDRVRITGYVGARFFGKSYVWQRAPQSLERCSNDAS